MESLEKNPGEASREHSVTEQLSEIEEKLRKLANEIEKNPDETEDHAQRHLDIVKQFLLIKGSGMKNLTKERDISRWQTAWHDLRKCPLEADLLTLMADEIHDLHT